EEDVLRREAERARCVNSPESEDRHQAVVVHKACEKQPEDVAVLADVVEGLDQLPACRTDDLARSKWVHGWAILDHDEQRNREQREPAGHEQIGGSDVLSGLAREAERWRFRGHEEEVTRQEAKQPTDIT